MTIAEYYGFPEGTKANFKYLNFYDSQEDNYPCPSSMRHTYAFESRNVAILKDTSNVTDMSLMFAYSTSLTSVPQLDTSNVTSMYMMFYYCQNLTAVPQFDTSNVTDMSEMFYVCTSLTSVPQLDTSNVTNMSDMFYNCTSLKSIPPMDCSKISSGSVYPLYNSSTYSYLTDIGGFINMKYSWTSSYGLPKCPNLTYESCINILNGLYDFTGNGQTPTSSQGKLKVHANFLTAVGDEISIGTNKGWTITT